MSFLIVKSNYFKTILKLKSLFVLIAIFNVNLIYCLTNSQFHNEFTREWVAKVSDPLEADLIALETGFVNKGPVRYYMN
jgi:hypothetical protein